MRLVADSVFQLKGVPRNAINMYLVEDVLIDSGTPFGIRRIMRQVAHRPVRAHALTHAHPDHAGSSAEVAKRLGVPVWCGVNDVQAAEQGKPARAAHQPRFADRLPGVPPVHVDRALREGDEVAGFEVLDVPGHSPGHVAYWRESDRTLIAGDVFFNLNPLTGVPGLRPPPDVLTADPAVNRRSMRRLAELEPQLVLLGHGPPLRDARRLADLVSSLPA